MYIVISVAIEKCTGKTVINADANASGSGETVEASLKVLMRCQSLAMVELFKSSHKTNDAMGIQDF